MIQIIDLVDMPVSQYIATNCSHVLSEHDAAMLDYCHKLGKVYLGLVDSTFVCCWGLIPGSFLSDQAYLWMWAPGPIAHQFIFIRQSQIQVRKMLDRYPVIIGHCKRSSRSAQRWLKWLGAEFEKTTADIIPFTIQRAP
jgi:hypothetical protein